MIVLPSRGRVDSLRRFLAHSQPTEPGVVMVDDDQSKGYQQAITLPHDWTWMVGPRAGYVALLNRALEAYPSEPWYAYGGDDVLASPGGWDTALAAQAGRDQIAYGDDRINGEKASTLPFIGGDLVRRVGWLGLPTLKHLYCDTAWHDVGVALGRLRYCPGIITEHLHWSVGKQPYDQTAAERPIQGDQAAYEAWKQDGLAEVVSRCRS